MEESHYTKGLQSSSLIYIYIYNWKNEIDSVRFISLVSETNSWYENYKY